MWGVGGRSCCDALHPCGTCPGDDAGCFCNFDDSGCVCVKVANGFCADFQPCGPKGECPVGQACFRSCCPKPVCYYECPGPDARGTGSVRKGGAGMLFR
jgi:hypothetical protein